MELTKSNNQNQIWHRHRTTIEYLAHFSPLFLLWNLALPKMHFRTAAQFSVSLIIATPTQKSIFILPIFITQLWQSTLGPQIYAQIPDDFTVSWRRYQSWYRKASAAKFHVVIYGWVRRFKLDDSPLWRMKLFPLKMWPAKAGVTNYYDLKIPHRDITKIRQRIFSESWWYTVQTQYTYLSCF